MPAILLSSALLLSSCSPPQSPWRASARLVLDRIQMDEAARLYPAEFSTAHLLLAEGDRFLEGGMPAEAEARYRSSWSAATEIERRLQEKRDTHRDLLQQQMETIHLELSHARALLERRGADPAPQKPFSPPAAQQSVSPPPRPHHQEKKPVLTHSVRRGESLPQIAARPEIYGDSRLWPLIYRSNRDQIADPRRLWPGQLLKIPRAFSPEEAAEARRYAARSRLF